MPMCSRHRQRSIHSASWLTSINQSRAAGVMLHAMSGLDRDALGVATHIGSGIMGPHFTHSMLAGKTP